MTCKLYKGLLRLQFQQGGSENILFVLCHLLVKSDFKRLIDNLNVFYFKKGIGRV